MNKHTTFSIFLLVIVFAAGFLVGNYFSLQDLLPTAGQQILVTQVVDGDTITIEGGARVRLLGIDAREKGEEFYSEARDFLKSRILNKEVKLEKDVTNKDVYKRYLRYVWLNDSLINAEIVREGLAIAKLFEPDTKYQYLIAQAEQEAINSHVGIWATS